MTNPTDLVSDLAEAARKAAGEGRWHDWGLLARSASMIDEQAGELNTAISLLRAGSFHGPFSDSVAAYLGRFDEKNRPLVRERVLTPTE